MGRDSNGMIITLVIPTIAVYDLECQICVDLVWYRNIITSTLCTSFT